MTTGETAPGPRGARNPAEFVARLQLLKDWSGLTYRELSARSAALGDVLPRSTVANMLARATLPREELLAAFVRACGVDPDGQADWEAVRKELAARGAYGAGTAEAGTAEAGTAEAGTAEAGALVGARAGADAEELAEAGLGAGGEAFGDGGAGGGGGPLVWPGSEGRPAAGPPPREDGPTPVPDPRSRLRRTLVGAVGVAALLLAAATVIAFVREDAPAHGRAHGHAPAPAPAPGLAAPAEGPVHIRVIGSGLCLGERRGSRSGQIHQRDCAGADVPLYSLKRLPGDRWRIVSDHPDYGPGCSGIPSGGRMPDAALEDSECGDPSRVERFALEPYGTPVAGYRIVPAGSATSGSCVTVTGDRTAEWSRLAQAPCTPDAAGQLFSFDRRA
ncbi:helix-turn-helix domain-containing protein [Streptomyces sp. NPDC127092]|uniref:helix-turn-helix domain-containing protein n=1 Tax=Streptomyces sp. NPDC127092 TaxID=3347135 RepID=UPI00364AF3EC